MKTEDKMYNQLHDKCINFSFQQCLIQFSVNKKKSGNLSKFLIHIIFTFFPDFHIRTFKIFKIFLKNRAVRAYVELFQYLHAI